MNIERAERTLAKYFNRPRSAPRLAMASQLIAAYQKSPASSHVTMAKLAAKAASKGDTRLADFTANYVASRPTVPANVSAKKLWHNASVAMNGFLADFKKHLCSIIPIRDDEKRSLFLGRRGPIHPESAVWLYPAPKQTPKDSAGHITGLHPRLKEFSVITAKRQREQYDIGPFHAFISPKATLHILASRIGEWQIKEFFDHQKGECVASPVSPSVTVP